MFAFDRSALAVLVPLALLVLRHRRPADIGLGRDGAPEAEHARAVETIGGVPLPDTDPIYGPDGPLKSLWR